MKILVNKTAWFKKSSMILVCLMSAVVFVFHIHGTRVTSNKTFDESVNAQLALQIKLGQEYNTLPIVIQAKEMGRAVPQYLSRALYIHPPLFAFLIQATVYHLLPEKSSYSFDQDLYILASKIPNIMGSLLIILVFLIGRRYCNVPIAFLAAFLLAIDFNLWTCSQKVWIETTLTYFFWLTLYWMLRGINNKNYFLLAGFAGGLAMLTKYPSVLIYVIFLTYSLIYQRQIFKQPFFYMLFLIPFCIFLPWGILNFQVYGVDVFNKLIFQQRGKDNFFMILAILSAAVTGLIVLIKQSQLFIKIKARVLQLMFVMAVGLFGYLVLQIDFRESIVRSLTWSSFPRSGWDLNFFSQDPWYFYFKQILEYSPLYLFFYVGVLHALIKRDEFGIFLVIVSFWTLLAGILWGGFQGRYILMFVPAATLLMARAIFFIYGEILTLDKLSRWLLLCTHSLILAYFIAKSCHHHYHLLSTTIAYY